jgi:secondary thiamine-phosphate synthase enzyme
MEFTIKSSKREEILDITQQVKDIVFKTSDEDSKACLVYVPHATCAIIINENYDKAVCEDILKYLKKQIPEGQWEHDKIDNNADSHIKSSIIGPSQVIPIKDGKLMLGRWQSIGLAEFDGPRDRRVIVNIL